MTAPRITPSTPGADWTYQDALAAVQRATRAAFLASGAVGLAPQAGGSQLASGARAYRDGATRLADGTDAYNANAAYLAGDHWQDGAPWLGPRGGALWDTSVKAAVQQQFVPIDVIGEVLERVANALLKVEAAVTFAPVEPAEPESEAAKAQAAEADAMLALVSAWWDRVRLWEAARTATKRARALRRGVLQLWIPPGHLDRVGDARRLRMGIPLADAFARVELAAPAPEHAAVLIDPETQQPYAVVLSERVAADGKAEPVASVWTLGKGQTLNVREIPERGTPTDYTLPFTRLPVAEMAAPVLITEAVRRQQAQLNFGSSLLGRLLETAGFAERYISNAEPNGEWSQVAPDGEPLSTYTDDTNTVWYLHPAARTLGAATTQELTGIKTERVGTDGATQEIRATPGVYIKEPTDPAGTIAAKREIRATILESCKQGHVLANGDATVSGYSREQARAEFEDDLASTKAPLEGMLREVIEAVVAWALAMAGGADAKAGIAPGFLERYRVVVTASADSGPLSPDERRAIVEEHGKGLRSLPSTLALLGTEDVAAELELIAGGEVAQLARLKAYLELLEVAQRVTTMEAGLRALVKAGLDAEIAAALLPKDTDGAVEDGGDEVDDDNPNQQRIAA